MLLMAYSTGIVIILIYTVLLYIAYLTNIITQETENVGFVASDSYVMLKHCHASGMQWNLEVGLIIFISRSIK